MNELEVFDTEQLEAELKRRKEEEEKRNIPQPVTTPDWTHVRAMVIDHIFSVFDRGYGDSDTKHYIYEAAIEAVYGKNVWPWINARLR